MSALIRTEGFVHRAGPGRDMVVEGFRALRRGAPDMNSLVGLGAVSSFAVSCAAAALPGLGWRTFFEEPAMLLGVVLLGRTLEQRQKLRASADMEHLQAISPLWKDSTCLKTLRT
jgi:Cu+-exporting ATPase